MTDPVVIIGAGPAGIAAALAASRSQSNVMLLDDNPAPGGQIWRGESEGRNIWLRRLAESRITMVSGARAVAADPAARSLAIEFENRSERITYSTLVLATGARELFLPFPGWTLPNVMGVGGLQALVKSGLNVAGKRIVVAGSGPLLLAVASYLKRRGARVVLVAEQASRSALAGFAASLWAERGKLLQAATLHPRLRGIRFRANCWVEGASGSGKLEQVHLRRKKRRWSEPCDYLANAYGFVPNIELAVHLGCDLQGGFVKVDKVRQTSVPGVYCAGEATGIAGVESALLEGRMAGHAAAGNPLAGALLLPTWRRSESFARALERAFRLRPELKLLAQPETVVCRCEDVTFGRLRLADSWRSAKLHERCGMGPCQGRICGPAVRLMLGWEPVSVRPPISPARLDTLLQENSSQ